MHHKPPLLALRARWTEYLSIRPGVHAVSHVSSETSFSARCHVPRSIYDDSTSTSCKCSCKRAAVSK
eukprot:1338722-Amphidinium_carterae.1